MNGTEPTQPLISVPFNQEEEKTKGWNGRSVRSIQACFTKPHDDWLALAPMAAVRSSRRRPFPSLFIPLSPNRSHPAVTRTARSSGTCHVHYATRNPPSHAVPIDPLINVESVQPAYATISNSVGLLMQSLILITVPFADTIPTTILPELTRKLVSPGVHNENASTSSPTDVK